LDRGKIIQRGTHEQLIMEEKGLYKNYTICSLEIMMFENKTSALKILDSAIYVL